MSEPVVPEAAKGMDDGLIRAMVAWVGAGGKPEHFVDGFLLTVQERAWKLPWPDQDPFWRYCKGQLDKVVWMYREGFLDGMK